MLSNQIQQWLDQGGSFQAGVQLYLQTGDRSYKLYFEQILQRPFVPRAAKDTLTRFLRSYLVQHPAASILDAPAKVDPPAIYAVEPAPIQGLKAKGRELLKQRDALRAQLVQMAQEEEKFTDAERFDLAQQIMDFLQPQIDDVYTKIRIWEENGELPVKGSVSSIVQETVEKFKRVMSLRPAISRLKKRFIDGTLNDEERITIEKEIREKGLELHELEDALGLQNTVLLPTPEED